MAILDQRHFATYICREVGTVICYFNVWQQPSVANHSVTFPEVMALIIRPVSVVNDVKAPLVEFHGSKAE